MREAAADRGDARAAETGARRAIVAACRSLARSGLTHGSSGNVSVRAADRMLITPSATAYDAMTPEMIAALPLAPSSSAGVADADPAVPRFGGPKKPSTEWRFHRDILNARPEIGAVVHTHSPYATALATARRAIPPIHYMIALFGGPTLRCAPYACFGTQALSNAVVAALDGRKGCLMANHGAIALGRDLDQAMALARELEALAEIYWRSLQIGGPALLSEAEIAEAGAAMAGYGAAADG